MRPHRLPRYRQYSHQRHQEEGGYGQFQNTRAENSPASQGFTQNWYHDSAGYDEWHDTNVYPHQRSDSQGYIANTSSGYADSSTGWAGYHHYDGHRQSQHGAPVDNDHFGGVDNVFSRDRNYLDTRSRHGRISRVSNNRQQTQSYYSSALTSSTLGNAGQVATEDFLNSRSRQHNHLACKADPPHLSMKKKLGPSEEYLKISAEKSETLGGATRDVEGPTRKLLVLDLNGTLVCRSPHRSWRDPGCGVTEESTYVHFDYSQPRQTRIAHPRPYLVSFRDYLFHPSTKQWLDTMVWSSAQPHNVDDMVEKCFGVMKRELVAIWARDRLGLAAGDYRSKIQTTKDLSKPWHELNLIPLMGSENSKSILLQRNHSAKTTLILDDSPLKVHLQPYNHLCLREYDMQMRKHDVSVRMLEVARERSTDVISGKQSSEEVHCRGGHDLTKEISPEDSVLSESENDSPELVSGVGDTNARKRKKKKDKKKKKRIDQKMQRLGEQGVLSYDETLLAVIGILDATKRETNVAAWMRSGGLIQLPMEQDHSEDGRASVELDEAIESPNKMEMSKDEEQSFENEDGVSLVGSKQVPSLPLGILSHGKADRCTEMKTEPSRVQVVEPSPERAVEAENDVQHHLWFNYPEIKAFWVSRGRKALKGLEIDIVSGVIGPTG